MERYARQILNYLDIHETLTTREAQKLLSVSEATARRIFALLAGSGNVERIHGGVRSLPNSIGRTIPFQIRKQWQSAEKELLARRALEFLKPDSIAFIHSGTTTLFLGKFISSGTFITDSVTLAELLTRRFPGDAGPEVILCGGTLDRKGGMLSGSRAEAAIGGFHADFMITSVRGIDSLGPIETDEKAVGIQRRMMENSAKVIVIADHNKFRRNGYCYLARWREIDVLITTDIPENRSICEGIRAAGTQVITLPPPESAAETPGDGDCFKI